MTTDEIKRRVGKRIKSLREWRGLSQQEVADYLGIHRPSITEIEHGRRNVSAQELYGLSLLFELAIKEFFR